MLRTLIALAAVAAMSVALVAVAGAKPQIKHVESEITLTFTNGPAVYSPDEFAGRVKATKSCKKQRTVTIDGTTLSDTTDSSGDYLIAAGDVAPGSYTATVAAKDRKTNNGTKIVCEEATSEPVTVP